MVFGLILEKIRTILSINSTFIKLEDQNIKTKCQNKNFLQNYLEPNAFLDKQFGQACNFFALRLRMLISFLKDVDI